MEKMTISEFRRRLNALGADGKTIRDQAACAVLVHGDSVNASARTAGCNLSMVSRRVREIRDLQLCPHCAQSVQPHK